MSGKRVLMTEPHDGHPDTEECPGCPHADDFQPCNDCGRATDENDAAPSCGSHVLCVSCFTTGDFRCRECLAVWREVARAETW